MSDTSGYPIEVPNSQYISRTLRQLRQDVDKAMRLAVGAASSGSGYLLGAVVAWPGTSAPPASMHLLELNGQTVVAADYADLAALHPEWVSGPNLVLPDYGTRTLVGYKSGDADFGTLGALVGSKTHTHPLSDAGQAQVVVATTTTVSRAVASAAWNNTTRITGTASGTVASQTTGAALTGSTDAASDIQPSVVVKFYVCAVSSLGEFDPAVQNALSADVAALQAGYRFVERVVYTSSGSFTKASYPYLRMLRVIVQGAGGAGGGITSASTVQGRCGGGAGGYAEKRITDIAGLAASETITIGAAATGGTGTGPDGGASSAFGVTGNGGTGGGASPGSGGTASGGDDNITGQPGGQGSLGGVSTFAIAGFGGSSRYGSGGAGIGSSSGSSNGNPGTGYGSGGGGGARGSGSTAFNGGNSTQGVIIVELYA